MSGVFTNLLIQVIAGAIGGNVAGGASKELSLGTAGNTDCRRNRRRRWRATSDGPRSGTRTGRQLGRHRRPDRTVCRRRHCRRNSDRDRRTGEKPDRRLVAPTEERLALP